MEVDLEVDGWNLWDEDDRHEDRDKGVSLCQDTTCYIQNEWQLLEEELTCTSCENVFVGPKTVPCLHTFCVRCVESAVDAETGNFTCAVCSAVFSKEEIADIPVNASIGRLVAITKKHKGIEKACGKAFDKDASDLTATCGQCEEGTPATWWCLVCDDAEMCEECYKSHCRLKVYKSHKVVSLKDFIQSPKVILNCSPQPDYCKEHIKNPLDLYCNSCCEFVCTACPCSTSGSQKKHDVDTVNNVCEAKRVKIKEMNEMLWSLLQNADMAIQYNKIAEQQLNENVTKEIEWVHQSFEKIRKLVDQHEEDILSGLETFKSTKEGLLITQRTKLDEFKERLSQCTQFTSSILFPFRSKELFMYSEWITDKMGELSQEKNLEAVYKADDDNALEHDSFAIDELDYQLSLLHHMCNPPHLPYCTVSLLNKTSDLIEIEVLLRDQQSLPVSYQLPYLDFKSDKPKQFFTNVDWKTKEKGVYVLLYTSEKSYHKLAITWKDSVIHEIKVWEEEVSLFCIQQPNFNFGSFYSKETIISTTPRLLSFDHVHPPYCKVNVLTNTLAFVEAEVILNDESNHPVSGQVAHLSVKSEIVGLDCKSAWKFLDFKCDWKYKENENGVYTLLCTFKKKKHQTLTIIWKSEVVEKIQVEGSLFHYPMVSRYDGIQGYNKKRKRRNLREPKFLTNSLDALIVSDPGDNRLILFNKSDFYDRVITNGNQIGFKPSGTAIDPYGHLYVANTAQNCIMRFEKPEHTPNIFDYLLYDRGCSFDGISSSYFSGWSLTGDDRLQNPQGLVISKCGFMYICDQGNNRIQVYHISEDGKEQFRYSYCGQDDSSFSRPTDVALNTGEDKLFVTDTDNHRVQVLTIDDPTTTEITYSFSIEHASMQFPFSVFCTVDGEVIVSAKDNVFVFKEDGTYVFAIDFKDQEPTGVTVNQRGMLVVSLTQDGEVVFYS
ncbi:tripartite motif-containing protein 2-like [Dysidea avara]|uniref:tripartite motif-containing protein 2-like n=1 Tax=Dysidea avara TaxID=196820 RepID=UPI00333413E8